MATGDLVCGGVRARRVTGLAFGVGEGDAFLGEGARDTLTCGTGVARLDAGGGAPVSRRSARATPGSEMIAPTVSDTGRPDGGACRQLVDDGHTSTPRSWASSNVKGDIKCLLMNDRGCRPLSSLLSGLQRTRTSC